MRELREEIEEADARYDAARAERAREELEGIVDVLSGAFGLHGRARALGSDAERARSAVTWRVRSAIRRIPHHLGEAGSARLRQRPGNLP